MKVLFENSFFRLEQRENVAVLVRTATPFGDRRSIEDGHAGPADVLAASGLRRCLVDVRGSPPGRNDPLYEQASAAGRKRLHTICERTAVLVRSAAGKLQIQRLVRADGTEIPVFLDEKEAWDYLLR